MTKRKLINKKSHEEMLLLKKLTKNDLVNEYIISIQIDENDNESFVINHYKDSEWIGTIVGENYTKISKLFITYLDKL